MTSATNSQLTSVLKNLGLKKLTVEQIDRLLESLGEHGEIHLIVQRGVLKYMNRVESQRVWKDEEQE